MELFEIMRMRREKIETELARQRTELNKQHDPQQVDSPTAASKCIDSSPRMKVAQVGSMFGGQVGHRTKEGQLIKKFIARGKENEHKEHVQHEEAPKAGLDAILARRRAKIDIVCNADEDIAEVGPGVKARPRRDDESLQRVMEARRAHIADFEKKSTETGVKYGSSDVDMALACGATMLREIEKRAALEKHMAVLQEQESKFLRTPNKNVNLNANTQCKSSNNISLTTTPCKDTTPAATKQWHQSPSPSKHDEGTPMRAIKDRIKEMQLA